MNKSDSFLSYLTNNSNQVKNMMACIFTFLMLVILSPDMFAQSITQIQPLNGTAGNSITIYGSGFDVSTAANTVRFTPAVGGSTTTATVTSASATKLIVTIPALTGGNYTLSVQRASDSATATFLDLFAITTGGVGFGTRGSSGSSVSSNADVAYDVFAADVDGDGDLDLMSASSSDDKIAWYENDGSQSFTERLVNDDADGTRSVHAADVDGDGDIDFMAASNRDDKIAWYENDGSENFTERVVSTNAVGAYTVFAADVDGDGDVDLMSASSTDDKIAWYENNGAANPSFTERVVSTNADGAYDVFAADVDGDGDIDLLSASLNDDKIAWYENDGATNPTFTERVVSTDADRAYSVFAGDVDGDGDLDLMSASNRDDKIAWYENNGAANPTFTEHVVSTNANGAHSVFAGDVDGDGDIDLMSASSSDDKIAWYENDGNQNFTEHVVSTNANGASSVYAGDVDGDGDIDLMSASFFDDEITWYENTPPSYEITQIQPLNAAAGTSVTIYGSGFDASTSDNTISFIPAGGGSATTATVTAASANKLTVTVPSLTGGNYTLSAQRASDNAITTSIDLFSISTGGGDFGAVGSSENIVSTDANYAVSVFAGDVDGDGDLDLMSASRSGDKLAWYENDGNQNFTEHVVSTNVDGARSVFAADVDNDGDLDLLSASENDDKIAWFENDGATDPSFTERVVSTGANGAKSVFSADVDGDGDIDIMSASFNDDKISWYENNGAPNPSFTERTISTTADGAYSVFAGDVDGDGDIDLMSASTLDDKIAWYENDGAANPTFTVHVVSTDADATEHVHAADVDGDGDLDILSASFNDDKIAWYENDGTAAPSFTERVVSTNANGARSVFTGDVDGDGDLDLMSASFNDSKVAWYESDGASDPSFTQHIVSTSASNANSIFAADVNGDGNLDLLSASTNDDKIAWYENTSSSAPLAISQLQQINALAGNSVTIYGSGFDAVGANNTVSFTPATGGTTTTATVTSNGINRLNVTVPALTGGNYSISVQRISDGTTATSLELFGVTSGGGDFGAVGSSERVVSTNADEVYDVFAADVDGDGDLDFLSASANDDKIAWHENDGNQNFTERVVSTNADFASSVFATDVDGDGDLDILSASQYDDKVAWYENDGNQNFTERVVSTNAEGAYSVFTGDVDGDGDLDLMSASSSDDKIAWYENDGSQNFTEHIVSTNANTVISIFATDVDGDGDLDLMSASQNDSKIAWYENDGAADPSFTERVVSTNANGARSVYAGDVDGDGDIDLMSASSFDDKIAWYENDGNQNFTERVVSTSGDFPTSVFAGDVDGDGDLDLLSASFTNDRIAWYKNDGAEDPTFAENVLSSSADGGISVFASDMDGDGDLDIISASQNDDKIAWYENTSPTPTIAQILPLSGTPGTSITIYGSGFDGATADNTVKFTPAVSGTAITATVTLASANRITATVPTITGGNYTLSVQRARDNATVISTELFAVTSGGGNFGAVGSSERVVSTNADATRSVHAADVDSDGDLDLLSAANGDSKVYWYENDGSQSFTERMVGSVASARSVFSGDVDGDGDLDVISAGVSIIWHENDGNQNFALNYVNTDVNTYQSVHAADVDGDGDLDFMSADNAEDEIAWYENDGATDPTFTKRIVSTNANGAFNVYAKDIDDDGDIDLMSASTSDHKIAWYENDGAINPSFSERIISTNANFANSVHADDVDGDGDIDVISASFEDKIAWYENDGAADPTFTEHVVSTNADGAYSVYSGDLDGDGDLDLMSASANDNKIAWYENDGATDPTYTEHVVSTNASLVYSVFAADIDNDGDLDIMSASNLDDKIAWYENTSPPTSITQVQPLNGAAGTSITMYGSGFSPFPANNTVRFTPTGSGTPTTATVTSASKSQLTITVPAVQGGNFTLSVQRASETATSLELFAVSTGGGDFGAVESSEHVVSTNADGAESVYAADVDGDGDIDLMSASFKDDKIAWYENDGATNPTFTEHVVSTNASFAFSVHAGDVDADGDLDLMSASFGDDKIAWYENDGSQNFTEHVVSTNADGAYTVFAGDVDGDGDLDIMSASDKDDKIAWYENDGAASPTFTERVVSTNADAAFGVFASDVDGDGDLDLLSASRNDDKIAWYENNGAPNPAFTEHVVSTNADGAYSVYATDVDSDGDLDLMSASQFDSKIAWYENNGSQTFTERVVSTSAGAFSVFGGDVDGDGDNDLMSAAFNNGKIAWYENDGSENFTERIVSTNALHAYTVYAADVDGDGDLDLMSASDDEDKIAWYENTSPKPTIAQLQPLSGTAGTTVTIFGSEFDTVAANNIVSFTPGKGGTVATATVTSASKTQLTVTVPTVIGGNYTLSAQRASDSEMATSLELFAVSTGGGDFGAVGSSERVVSTNADGATNVFASDVDGDGDLDLMSASYTDDKIAWYENDGTQTFTERVVSTAANGAYSIYSGDLDGDGDIDLMSASIIDDKIAWYENDGSQSFSERVISTNADGARSVYAGDVDGDGDLDLISASFYDGKIAWYENDGDSDPSFTEQVVSTNAGQASSVFAADIDDDGDLDLMSASISDAKIAWYENNGSQNFTERVVSTNANGARSVYAGDVDGDGDLDLMSASFYDDKIAWYENDGTQTFTEHIVSTNVDEVYSIQAGDVDGDGDLDLMSASANDDKIAWYENNGSQNFTERVVSTNADFAYSIYAADVDSDGDLDLMSASFFDDNITWFENKSVLSTGGRSLAFDGTGDFLEVVDDNALDFTNGFTMEAWVRPATIDATFQQLLGKEDAYRFGFNNSVLRFSAFGVQDYDLSFSLTADQWSHLAVVFDAANNATFYVNGANVGTIAGSAPVTASANVLDIGQNGSDGEFLNGVMDELRLWNAERTALQIQQNLFQALAGDEAGLVAYFSFNEENGSTTLDATANSFSATFNGNVAISDNTHPFGTVITGTQGWRLFSTPVGGASYGELLSGVFTQGFAGADTESGTSNVFTYDEATKTFNSIANAADVPATGSGFIVYVFEDDDPVTAGIQGGFPKTVLTDSSQNEGATSASLNFTDTGTPASDGFNLIGNPYGATIDWDAASGWTKTNLDDTFYVWSDSANGGAGAYLSWNGITGTQGDGKIAPWQGFWVKANAADPVLSLTDQVRSSGGMFLKKNPASTLYLTLEGDGLRSSTIVSFQGNASISKDRYDTYKLQSLNASYLSLFTQLENGTGLDINALPENLEESLSIPLDFTSSTGSENSETSASIEMQLSWKPKNLPEGMTMVLVDNQNGTEIDLTETSLYKFEMEEKVKASPLKTRNLVSPRNPESQQKLTSTPDTFPLHGLLSPKVIKAKSSESTARFVIEINSGTSVSNEPIEELPTSVELQQNYPNPFNPSTTIAFGVPQSEKVTLEVFDLLGRKVATLLNGEKKSAGRYTVNFDARNLSSGMYIYRLQAGNSVITKKLTLIK